MGWKIPLFKIYWDNDDVTAIEDVISSGMNWATGENTAGFEREISGYIGSPYCLTFNSGTSALHAILLAHGIGKGDQVIVPSFTFIATANAPGFVGAKPVFADIEDRTFGLDPDCVVEKISKKTRAIIPVHYGGCPCRIRELREIADDRNLLLIEDAAEAFGAKIGNTKMGTIGDSAVFSFCQNKIISTGEGGAVVTPSKELYEKMKLIRSHGRLETTDYFTSTGTMDYVALGYNFRLPNINAALGISQMKKIDLIISNRRRSAHYYQKALSLLGLAGLVPDIPKGYYHVYQLFSVLVKRRDALMQYLEQQGIMTKIYFSPVHLTSYYKDTLKYRCSLPVTERIANEVVSLPFYPGMPRKEADLVIQNIKEFMRE